MTEVIDFIAPYSAQGDLNIFVCEEIPTNTNEANKSEIGHYVLAHSETGHNHVISGAVTMYDENEFISYLDVSESSNVVHLRNFDTHKTIKLPPGKYRITRQREYIAEGFRRAAD